ncbi:MAG: bifunctional [glutamine synthetase] adenylyltransferase/[glutamine synthetase]-adenylyl-L-tyrosine phosphorylase [Rhizomicrobium sp.]|jgi:glutamate-ammonia-ligase adenylyltransferase
MNALPAHPLPRPFDPARAQRTLAALAEMGFQPEDAARGILAALAGNSPYLARLALREHAFLPILFAAGPDAVLPVLEADVARLDGAGDDRIVMGGLRRAKRRMALAVAAADIAGQWTLEQVTRNLSQFADCCVGAALRFLLRERATTEGLDVQESMELERETGFIVIAMGKYGAFELNYSSDIDLIVLYDAERFPFRKKGDARGAAVDITKGLIRLIGETTSDGYVFRVDLRLRPDAGATQVAISSEAAELYYESMGQNWERAAMIKARACAGDLAAGRDFLKAIEPFTWRRNLDFAAIEDIHSIKRQIHAHGRHGAIAVAGHNVKLGRGGIREIEFFAQTQQLILGGRNPELRVPRTLDAIAALRAKGLVSGDAADDLTTAYRFLRTIEHRLQMIDDEQTHSIPKSADGIDHVACFVGCADATAFGHELVCQLEAVQSHYARLFEREAPLGSATGSLVFTGVEDDPATIETLQKMGFRQPSHAAGTIRGWHHGRIRATRSDRARELLTKLMPALLDALAATADPDEAFVQFDRFVSRLPAGVQLFSLLLANPALLNQIATIAGSAPKLADAMARAPQVLDALLDAGFAHELPARAELDRLLRAQLSGAKDYEAELNAARRFAREQIFRVGLQVVEGTAEAEAAGAAFADVAECCIAGLVDRVTKEHAGTAGRIAGSAFAVVAMGKLGGREMTAASDLDLIFVYDVPRDSDASDGAKSLSPTVYFARLAQRLIAALTVQTSEGGLYDVDMRLRPSGNQGPVAVHFDSFSRYYRARDAWTWERLALTRARVLVAPDALRAGIEDAIGVGLRSGQRGPELAADVIDMRKKLAGQFPARSAWDLKFSPGGIVDIEFIAQFLQLKYADLTPSVFDQNTVNALGKLKSARAIRDDDADMLIAASELQHALTQALRIAVDGVLDPRAATPGLQALLARAGHARDFAELGQKLESAQVGTHALFEKFVSV